MGTSPCVLLPDGDRAMIRSNQMVHDAEVRESN